MGAIEEWKRREELRSKLRLLDERYQQVYQLVANAQYEQASELVTGGIFVLVEELGSTFTLTQWPVCLGCFPTPGTGEAGPTDVKATPTLCVDAPSLCHGNQYGRMHPSQLLDFIMALHEKRLAAAQQREVERAESQRVPEPVVEEMRPTQPPVPPELPPAPAAEDGEETGTGDGEDGGDEPSTRRGRRGRRH